MPSNNPDHPPIRPKSPAWGRLPGAQTIHHWQFSAAGYRSACGLVAPSIVPVPPAERDSGCVCLACLKRPIEV